MIFIATLIFIFMLGLWLSRRREPDLHITIYETWTELQQDEYPDAAAQAIANLTDDELAMLRTLTEIFDLEEVPE